MNTNMTLEKTDTFRAADGYHGIFHGAAIGICGGRQSGVCLP